MPILHESKIEEQEPNLNLESSTLEVSNLHYTYPDGQKALQGINLTMDPNEKIALAGPNGSGKSTLLLNIIGLFQGEGGIKIGGIEVVEDSLPIIRASVGFVFQNPDDQLFSPTVFEDVAFGPLHMGLPEDIVHQKVENALNQVHMLDYSNRLSHHLSMGEKKRIAIATVLSMEPDILLLDEPTAGLDPRARRNLINLLEELPQSMLVATHDLFMVRELFHRMIILDKGVVVADCETDEILQNDQLLNSHGLEMPI